MKGQPLVPTLDPSESGSISHVAESTSAELPSEPGMCQVLPSPSGPTTAPAGSRSPGKAGRELGRFLPAGAAVGLIQLELPCLAPQASRSRLEAVASRRSLPARQLSLGARQLQG